MVLLQKVTYQPVQFRASEISLKVQQWHLHFLLPNIHLTGVKSQLTGGK